MKTNSSLSLLSLFLAVVTVARAERVYSDANGGYITPEGRVTPDWGGGYFTPQGHVYSDGVGGYYTPNGRLASDGRGGYYTSQGHVASDALGGFYGPSGRIYSSIQCQSTSANAASTSQPLNPSTGFPRCVPALAPDGESLPAS